MKCVRCGSELKDTDRCCLKCGAINYNNPLNEEYAKKYADKEELLRSNEKLLKNNKNKVLSYITIIVILIIFVSLIAKLMS